MFDLDELMEGNDEYIDDSYVRVCQLFNKTWLGRYPCPHRVMFEKGSELEQELNILIRI